MAIFLQVQPVSSGLCCLGSIFYKPGKGLVYLFLGNHQNGISESEDSSRSFCCCLVILIRSPPTLVPFGYSTLGSTYRTHCFPTHPSASWVPNMSIAASRVVRFRSKPFSFSSKNMMARFSEVFFSLFWMFTEP